jgi:hypothetical protein
MSSTAAAAAEILSAVSIVSNRHHDGQVPGRKKEACFVLMALGSVTENAPVNRGGDVHHEQLLDDGIVERRIVPPVGLSHEHSQKLGGPCLASMGELGCWLGRSARELHHGGVLHLDQAIGDHLVKRGQDLIHLLRSLDELDAHRQVLSQHLDLGRVQQVVSPEAGVGTGGRCAGDSLVHQKRHDRFVQGRQLVLGIFVDEDGDFLGGPLVSIAPPVSLSVGAGVYGAALQ